MQRSNVSHASAAASLTGFASNVTGGAWALTANDAGDSLAHKVTVKNDTANDHSAKTATLVGTDANGQAQTETVNLPAGSATVTSTKYFKTLTSVTPSATIGADTMDIGWAAASVSPNIQINAALVPFNVGFGCAISGTPNYTVQHSYEGATWFNHASVAAKTADADGSYTSPVTALRLLFAAAGTVSMHVLQSGKAVN